MKLNKIFLLATMALVGLFSACSSDDDDYTPGKVAGNYDVSFDGQQNQTLEQSATTFDVTLYRTLNTGEALTVPIEKINVPSFCTVPESATFAAGETITTLTVALGEGTELNKDYTFSIRIPEEYTNPYTTVDEEYSLYPIYSVTITKEDYSFFATGSFVDPFWYEDYWDITIEYSPSKDIYRIKNLWEEGYHFYFHWNRRYDAKQEFWFTDSEGEEKTKMEMGYVHPTYGMVSVTALDSYAMGYDTEQGGFMFPFQFTVSAGSFGAAYVYIVDLKFVDGFNFDTSE